MPPKALHPLRIAFLLDSLSGGGAEKVMLTLAEGFANRGYIVDLLVCKMKGALLEIIPSNVTVIPLAPSPALSSNIYALCVGKTSLSDMASLWCRIRKVPFTFRYLRAISRYIIENRPAALLAALPKSSVNAVLAKHISGVSTRILVGVHSNHTFLLRDGGEAHMQGLVKSIYPRADVLVAVSHGVASDIASIINVDREKVTTIYNPIPGLEISKRSIEPAGHPWFDSGTIPVILGIGRFSAEKNFPLLLKAFAMVRRKRPVRLVLLGGDDTSQDQRRLKMDLMAQAEQLDVSDAVDMPGFTSNPFAYLSKASVFVLSSRYEGFGNVLVEAMLCGCPVVSTDCPSGPAEILDNGKYGELVPVDDDRALADAIFRTLDNPPDGDYLRSRGNSFSVENAVDQYQKLLLTEESI